MKHYSNKFSISKLYNSFLAMALILLVTITITLLAALTSGEQAMKRESDVIRYAPGNPAYEVMRSGEPIVVNLAEGYEWVA